MDTTTKPLATFDCGDLFTLDGVEYRVRIPATTGDVIVERTDREPVREPMPATTPVHPVTFAFGGAW